MEPSLLLNEFDVLLNEFDGFMLKTSLLLNEFHVFMLIYVDLCWINLLKATPPEIPSECTPPHSSQKILRMI